MNFLKKWLSKTPEISRPQGISAKGILVFHHTSDVIAAESRLKFLGIDLRVMGPPPGLRTGCDLVIEFPLIRELEICQELKAAGIHPLQIVPVQDVLLEPVSLFQTKDFGDYLMVRAANMKLTIHKLDRRIVNISGGGSAQIYRYLVESGVDLSVYSGFTFHYLQPDVDWHNRILLAIEALLTQPLLIADAGYMYVAKMSGYAGSYDLFTPDAGELAFLADERAPHPFYTRGFLLHEENHVPDLIARAVSQGNAARNLLVKGQADVVVSDGKIVASISDPCVETMEPIGGTGDSLVGLVTALASMGVPVAEACIQAARINRYMGYHANPTPAFSISDLLKFLPQAVKSSS
jgi:hypothetical protein